jgi:hypothetical protein
MSGENKLTWHANEFKEWLEEEKDMKGTSGPAQMFTGCY